jgi:transposase-like protein
MADSGNEESVWNILDKIIQASIHFKDTFRAGKSINNNRMTVKLCDYEL